MSGVTLPGTGLVVAADPIAAENHQLVKIEFGAAGVATQVSAANPLPVTSASLPLPTGAATEATSAAINATLTAGTVQLAAGAAVGATPSARAVQVSGSDYAGTPLSRAIKVDASGFQYIGNFPATYPVTGTFWQATQPVSGAFFQATQPVSMASDADNIASGTLTAAAQTVVLSVATKAGAAVQLSGTWVGTVTFEGTIDGTIWTSVNAVAASTSTPQPTTTVNGLYRLTPSGLSQIRVNMTAFTSGTVTVSMRAGSGAGGIYANQILPTKMTDGVSTATIKAASTAAAATDSPLVVTVHPSTATQPVSIATNTPDVTDRAGRLLGTIANTSFAVTNAGTFPVQAASTLAAETTKVIGTVNLSAAQTLATVTTVSAVTAITNALPVGANKIGTVDIATAPATAKGTQGANAVPTQDLKDAGRNPVHYYAVIPVLTTATDTLQSLTGTKGGVTVVATTTPAVVTAGKTLRVTRVAATYIATATSGYGIIRLRFNTAGVVAITSPIAATLAVGSSAPVTANATDTEEASLSEGWEFAAATGIGISVQGFAAVTAAAVGYVLVSVTGYEY